MTDSAALANTGDTATNANATADQAAAVNNSPWFTGIQNPDVRTWVEAKGFKDAYSAAESAYNLEKLIGFDRAGRTVVVPDENSSPETRQAFLQKLGVPEKPEGYGFKVPDGADDSFAKTAAEWLHKAGIPAKAGGEIMQQWNAYVQAKQAEADSAFSAQAEREIASLKTEWGAAYDQQIELGRRAALQFIKGSPEERQSTLGKLEKALGTAGMLKFMSEIGGGLGEHKMVQGNGSGVMTPAQAQQRIVELKSNNEWVQSYLNGDQSKAKEMQNLIAMANPVEG